MLHCMNEEIMLRLPQYEESRDVINMSDVAAEQFVRRCRFGALCINRSRLGTRLKLREPCQGITAIPRIPEGDDASALQALLPKREEDKGSIGPP